jgi:hypothetical protein
VVRFRDRIRHSSDKVGTLGGDKMASRSHFWPLCRFYKTRILYNFVMQRAALFEEYCESWNRLNASVCGL